MSVILILLTASLTIATGFLFAFIWSVKNGQYEDDYTPSVRMLFEDAPAIDAESRARDAKGLALLSAAAKDSKSRQKAEAIAEPEAARPGAPIENRSLNHDKRSSQRASTHSKTTPPGSGESEIKNT